MKGAERGARVEAVRWWAAYAYLEEAGVPGLASVRRDARRNITLSRRLLGKVRGKCAKTEGAGTAWIWVEDHSGLFYFPMPFAEMSLAAKTDALAELVGPLFEEYVHVAGIIVSNAAR